MFEFLNSKSAVFLALFVLSAEIMAGSLWISTLEYTADVRKFEALEESNLRIELLKLEKERKRREAIESDPYYKWNTYTNEEYAFEFRYPTSLTLYSDDSDLITLKDEKSKNQHFVGASIEINEYDKNDINASIIKNSDWGVTRSTFIKEQCEEILFSEIPSYSCFPSRTPGSTYFVPISETKALYVHYVYNKKEVEMIFNSLKLADITAL